MKIIFIKVIFKTVVIIIKSKYQMVKILFLIKDIQI